MENKQVFVDTNVFLRYITNDVPAQADAVEAMFRQAERGEVSLVTNQLVIAEIVWTLESFYRLSREDIKETVLAILNTVGLEVVDHELVLQAVIWYLDKNVDFIDAYSAAWMQKQGLEDIFTFDHKHFSRLDVCSPRRPL